MPAICYLCDEKFDNVLTVKHEEHIIQNSIGGALISFDILCEACGGDLGRTVDTAFAVALSPLTILFDTPRDRGDHSQTETRLIANTADAAALEQVRFILKGDFSVVPKRPVYFKSESQRKIMVIGATKKQADEYSKSASVRSAIAEGYVLDSLDNAAAFAQSLLVSVNPNSVDVLRGVLKIAIGYASHNGVLRENFSTFLEKGDLTNSEILLRSRVFSYYPTTIEERLFETEKHVHEDWYPTHHLYLFSQGKNLYCYVELFGTIQKYVHLTDQYSGPPLREKFVQKTEKWMFDEEIFTAKNPKDLHILAGEFGVSLDGRSWTDIQRDVLHEARIRAYALEPDNTVEKVRALIGLLAQLPFLKNVESIEVVQSMFKKANTAKEQFGLSLLDEIKGDPVLAFRLVRRTFDDFRIGDVKASCPERSRETSAKDLKRYEEYKFYELLRAKGRESVLQYTFT